jgi:DNA-binding transcriptional LysR family regulator
MQVFKNEQQGKLSWDDLRVVLAVAKAGSLTGAAQFLRLSHPTVFRRVRAIEAAMGVRLFERSRAGYVVSEAAAEMVTLAEQIDADINRLELSVAGMDERPSGLVRVTTVDTLMLQLLPAVMAELRQTLPGIQVELSTSNTVFSLSKREADIAIRPGDSPPEHLIGRRVCGLETTLYAPVQWPQASMDNLDRFAWVMPDDSLAQLASSKWLVEQGLLARAVLRTNSLVTVAGAANAGVGLAILPCYLGDRAPGLRRLCPPLPAFRSELWILSHPDLRRVRRLHAFIEKVLPALAAYSELFEGRAASS